MPQDKILSMTGLAKRAGKVTGGAPLCEKDIKNGKSKLIIIAKDISYNGKKAITDACRHYSVKYIEYADMYALGSAIGSEGVRTVVSVNDKNFADAILTKYAALETGRNGE
ncbi:MAG: ribosomal L7Ae/L30e/S12e/Gadd45 family protein [Clostridia bacterium]|nr:ribosomal L7Ae/L30e/S12e/Gadd45 family protein [Clostridia bacterium]